MSQQNKILAEWHYNSKEWDEFVAIEKGNKKEDNIYMGIGILIIGIPGLMLIKGTGFLTALIFVIPLAFLIPFLRFKFAYTHLNKNVKDPYIKIYLDHIEVNGKNIELTSKRKRVKSVKIIESKGKKLIEFDIQWITGKGPTNDEFRFLIPNDKLEEAEHLVKL